MMRVCARTLPVVVKCIMFVSARIYIHMYMRCTRRMYIHKHVYIHTYAHASPYSGYVLRLSDASCARNVIFKNTRVHITPARESKQSTYVIPRVVLLQCIHAYVCACTRANIHSTQYIHAYGRARTRANIH
jgi:hypothetical protein